MKSAMNLTRKNETHAFMTGRLVHQMKRSFSVKTVLSPVTLVAIAASIALAFSTGCVVAATGTNVDADDKSQTEQLDTTDNTSAGIGASTAAKLPDYDSTKAGGQGGGPDPSPWRETIAAQSGGPDGPDPSPWVSTSNTNTTRK
jgi:hypothetical protein